MDVHSLQTTSMYTKKPKEMGSQLMICGLVYCLNVAVAEPFLVGGAQVKSQQEGC